MATQLKPPPQRGMQGLLDALFREARRLQRRRRRRYSVAVLIAGGLLVAAGVLIPGSHRAHTLPRR